MANRYIILGAGGLARELYHNLREQYARQSGRGNAPVCAGFLDDAKTEMAAGYPPILGTIKGHRPSPEYDYYLGVGIPEVRRRVALLFRGYEHLFPAWHSTRNAEQLAQRGIEAGPGTLIEQEVLSCDIKIGKFALVRGVVGHDVRIGDYCEISTGAAILGGTHIEEGVHVAANCVTAPGVRIGAWSKISAGSAVMKDVPPCSLVVGVPGKIHTEFFLPPE